MFYSVVIAAYGFFIYVVVRILNGIGVGKIGKGIAILLLLAAPFWEQLWGNWLLFDFARHNSPLQVITRTVEKPGSVLWIDNVWPGFDENARAWMVANYLDGVHLHTLGLNGAGLLHVYRATPKDFAESAKMIPALEKAKEEYKKALEKTGGQSNKEVVVYKEVYSDLENLFRAKRKQEAVPIIKRSEIYILEQSKIDFAYRVTFKPLELTDDQKEFIWCDEISIDEMKDNGKEIAFSKRCLGYSPKIGVNPTGWVFYGGIRLGDEWAYEFDNKVLFNYAKINDECHSSLLNEKKRRKEK